MLALADKQSLIEAYMRRTAASAAQYEVAKRCLPGGVSRNAVFRKPYPIFIRKGAGQVVEDLDGNQYTDYCMNLGPILLGHAHPVPTQAAAAALASGWGFGAPTTHEADVAAAVRRLYPAAESVRFLNTGTEAIMHMIRVARAYTGRSRLVKFIGAYHGAQDGAQMSVRPAGTEFERSGWLSIPESQGIPTSRSEETLAVPFNDLDQLEQCLDRYRGEVAAVIADPAMNNCALAEGEGDFYRQVRELAHAHGALLLFDEVVSGFRWAPGGAAAVLGVTPDLVAFGKVLGGGAPIGAVAGAAPIMELLAINAEGKSVVPQSGTFAANPISLASALALLNYLESHPEIYPRMEALATRVRSHVNDLARNNGFPMVATGRASLFQIQAGVTSMRRYEDFAQRNADFRERLFLYMAVHGCHIPTPTGTFFLSAAHTEADLDGFLAAFDEFVRVHYGLKVVA